MELLNLAIHTYLSILGALGTKMDKENLIINTNKI